MYLIEDLSRIIVITGGLTYLTADITKYTLEANQLQNARYYTKSTSSKINKIL